MIRVPLRDTNDTQSIQHLGIWVCFARAPIQTLHHSTDANRLDCLYAVAGTAMFLARVGWAIGVPYIYGCGLRDYGSDAD